MGHLAQSVPPGSVRIGAESSDPLVRVVAFARPDGGMTIVAINNESVAVGTAIVLRALDRTPESFAVLMSREGAIWEAGPYARVSDGEAAVTLPSLSVETMTAP